MKVSDAVIGLRDLELVEFMNEVQTILNNGLYEFRITTAVPTWDANNGESVIYYSGNDRQLYFYVNGLWTTIGFSTGGTLVLFDKDGNTGITPEAVPNEDTIRFYVGGFYKFAMATYGFQVDKDVPVVFYDLTTKIVSSGSGYLTLSAGTQFRIEAPTYVAGNLTVTGSNTIGQTYFTDGASIIFGTETGTKIATGTNQKLAFFNAAPVVQQSALTASLTSVTFSEPTTPDYAIASLTTEGYGFAALDEGHTVLKVIANLQTRVSQLEARLQSYGLLP